MKANRNRIGLLLLPLIFLIPQYLLADGIDFPILIGLGLMVFIPTTAFIVFGEALVISKYLKISYRSTLWFAFVINLASFLSGFAMLFVVSSIDYLLLHKDIYHFFNYFLLSSIIGYLLYFGTSVLVEYFVGLRKRKIFFPDKHARGIFNAILYANLLSYGVLCPIHYYLTRPITEIRQVTKDVRWEMAPTVKIIYIDSKDHYLKQIDSDGRNQKVLIPYSIMDYSVSNDMDRYLYRGNDNSLYYFSTTQNKRVKIGDDKLKYSTWGVAISPSGRTIAYLKFLTEQNNIRLLVLFDVIRNKTFQTDYFTNETDYSPSIAWSNQENVFYIFGNQGTKKITFSDSMQIKIEKAKPEDFVKFVSKWYSSENEEGNYLSVDEYNDLKVKTIPGLGNELVISQHDKDIVHFTTTFGMLHIFGFGNLDNPSFIHEGKECIFEWGDSIYLMDIQSRKIGKITDGNRYILFLKKFSLGLLETS